jgi:hypothetical protein
VGDFEGAVDQEFADTFAQLDQLDLTQPDPTPTADPSAALGFAEEYPDVAAMIDEAMPASAPAQPAGEPISGFVDEFSTAFSQSFRHTERGKLGQQMIEEGSLSPEELASLDEINLQDQTEAKQAQIDADQELYIGTDAMGRVAGNIAGMAAANTLDPVSLKYTAAGAVAGALLPIPGGAWGGAATGTAIGNFMAMWNTEAGNKYLDLKEMRDPKTGGVIPDEIAADAADDFGFHQAMIEMTGLAVTVGATAAVSAAGLFGAAPAAAVERVVTGEMAKGFLKGVGEKLLSTRLAQATTKGLEYAAQKGGRALSIPASVVATGAAFATPEAFEELVQSIDEDRMENFAKAATNEAVGTEFEQVDWPTMISHGLDAFTAMWGGGFALGMVGMAGGHLIRHGIDNDQTGTDSQEPNTAAAMSKMAERTEDDIAQTRAERQQVADQAAGSPSVTVDEIIPDKPEDEGSGSTPPPVAKAKRRARTRKKIDKALGVQTTIDEYISATNPTADAVVRELNEEEQSRGRQDAVARASAAEQADAEAEVPPTPSSQQENEKDPEGAGPPIAVGVHRGDGVTLLSRVAGTPAAASTRKALYQALTFLSPVRDKVTGKAVRDDHGRPEVSNRLRIDGYRVFIYKDKATGLRRFGFAKPGVETAAQIDEVGRIPRIVAYDEEGLQVDIPSKGVRFLNDEESELVFDKLDLHAALVFDAEVDSTRAGIMQAHEDLLKAIAEQDAKEQQQARTSDASLVVAIKGTKLTPKAVERMKTLWRTASTAEKAALKNLVPSNYLRMSPEERRNFVINMVANAMPHRFAESSGTLSIFVPRATDIESNVELNDVLMKEFQRDVATFLGPKWNVQLSGVDQRGFVEKTKAKLAGRKAVRVEAVQAVERSAEQFRKLISDIYDMGAGALWADAHSNTARGSSRALDSVDRRLRQILQKNRVLLDDHLGENAKDGFGRVGGALHMTLALEPADLAMIAEDEELRKIVKVGMSVPGGYEIILHDAHLGATARKIAIVRLLIATGQIVYPAIGESVIDTAAPNEPASPMNLQRAIDENATPEMRAEIRSNPDAQMFLAGAQRPLDLQDVLEKLEAIQAEAMAEIEEMEKSEFLVWDEAAGIFHVRQRENMTDSELEAVLSAQAGPRINIWEGAKSEAVQALRHVCQQAGLMPQVFEDQKGRVDLILNYVSEEMENEIRRRVNEFAPGRTVTQTTSDPLQTHAATVTTGYEPGRDRETGDALPEFERQGLVVEKEQTLGAYRFTRSGHQLMISYSKRALHGTGIKGPEAAVSRRLSKAIEEIFGTDRSLIRKAQIRILSEWKKTNDENIKKYGIKVGLEQGKITFSANLSRNAAVVIAARLRQFKYQATRVQMDSKTGRTTFEIEAVGVDPEVSAVRRLMLAVDDGIAFERVITAQPKAADAVAMARTRLAHITDAMWEGVKKLKPETAKSGKLKMRKARVLLWEQTRRALFTDARNFNRNDDGSHPVDAAGRPIKLRYIENVRGRFSMVGSNIRDAAERARTGLYGEEAEFQQAITVLQSEGIDIGGEGFESPYQFSVIETEDWLVIPNRLSPGALTMLSSLIRSDENGYFVDRAAAGDVEARKDSTTEAKPIGMASLDDKAIGDRKAMIAQVQELFTALNNPEGMGELARRQLRFLGYVVPEKFIHENEDGSLEELQKKGQRAATQAVFASGDGKIFMVNAAVHRGWMDSNEGAALFVGPSIKDIGDIPSEHQRESIVMMKPGTAQVAGIFTASNLHVFGMEGLTEKEFRAAKAVVAEAERTKTEPSYPTAPNVTEEEPPRQQAPHRFRPTISKAPMSFNMSAENLRAELRKRYPRGVSTAQLMLDGLRTSTTRKPDQFDYTENGRVPQVGDVIEFSKVEGAYWVVEDVSDPAGFNAEQMENLSRREGWSVEFMRRYIHKNKGVLTYSLRQLSDIEVEEMRQKQAAEAGAPLKFQRPPTPQKGGAEAEEDPMGAGLGQTPESATDRLDRTAGKASGHKAASRRLWSKQFATLAKSMSQIFGGRLFASNGTKETQTRYINGKRVVDAQTNWEAMNRIARFFQVPSLKVSGPNRQWFSDIPTLNDPNPVRVKHTGRYRRLYAGSGQVMVWNSEAFGAFIHELGHHIAYGLKIPGLKAVYPDAPAAPNAEPRIIDTLEHLSVHAAGYYGKILGELRTAAETYAAGVDAKGNPVPNNLSGMTEQQIYQEGLAQFIAAYILDQNGCAQVFPNATKWMDDICAADKGVKGRMPLGRAFEETRRVIAKQAARTIWEAGFAGINQLSYYARMDFWERRVADAMKVWQQTQEFNEYRKMYGPAEAIRIKTNEFRYELWRQIADNGYVVQQISDMAERALGQRLAHDVNPVKLWRLAKGSDGRADNMLRHGFTSKRGNKVTKHRGFYQIIEPVNDHNTRMEFDLFLKDLRILEDHFSGRYGSELTHNVRLAENRLIEIEERLSKYGYVPVSRRGNLRSGGQWSYTGMSAEEKAKAQLFKSVAEELSKYNLGMLERMAEHGMIPWKTVTAIMSAHTMYSPLIMYLDNAVGNYLSQASVGHGATLYATTFANYDAEIQSPLESMMQNVVATERTIAATKVNVAIANLSTLAGMSQFVSAISYQELMLSPDSRVRALWQKLNEQARANGQQLDPALESLITQIFIESPDVQSVMQSGLSKMDGDRIIAIPRAFLSKELQEKANMYPGADPQDFDGSLKHVAFFRVTPDLHDLMTNASHSLYHHGALAALNDRDIDNYLFKVAAASAQWLRWGATTTLRFMLFNQMWDLSWAHFASKSGLRVFPKLNELAKGNVVGSHFVDAWKEVYGLGPQYQKFLDSGAGMAWLAAGDYDVTKQAEWEMRHPGLRDKLWSLASWSFLPNAVKLLQWMSRMTEESTRVAEFLAAQEQLAAQGGLSPEEIITEAAFRAREITVDFRRGGNMMQKWNRYEPFLNAQTQGAVRLLEVMDDLWGVERGDDGKLHFKNADSARRIRAAKLFFAYSFFPTLMLYALNHDDDEYAAIPEWEKRDFFHIPIHGRVPAAGWMKEDDVMGGLARRWTPADQYVSFLTIPKPRNLNGPTDLFIGFLDWLKKEDPAAHSKTMREMVGDMGGDVRDMAVSLLLPQIAQTTLETYFDYSLFKQAPIEGQWKKQKLPSERATPFNSKFAIYLSRALEKFGGPALSAPMIDYWIKGHFGGMGAQTTGFLDATVIGAGETIFGGKTPGPERSFGKTVPLVGELWDSMFRSNRMVGSKAMVDFYESYGGYLAASSAWKSAGSNARRAELISMYPEYLTKSGPVASLSRRMKWGKNKLDDTMELVNKTFASDSLTPRQKQLRAEYLYNQAGLIASMAVTGARPSQQQKEKMQALKTRALKRAS